MTPKPSQEKPLKVVGDYEAWRPALIAFYKADCWFQTAENLERSCELSAQDKRLIEVLSNALDHAPAELRKAA